MSFDHWLTWLTSFLIVLGLLSIGSAMQEWRQWREDIGMASDDDRMIAEAARRYGWIVAVLAVLALMLAAGAFARDLDGRFAGSALKPWFDQLHSGGGALCCSDADGTALSDVDWETRDGHYRVRLEGEWIDVPDDAVITEPNRAGRTMVWPWRRDGRFQVRCFMPGSMT